MITRPSQQLHSAARAGFTLMEVTIAAAALGLLTVAILQATFALERARKATERIDFASREMDNLMERFLHQPWDAISQTTAADLALPEQLVTHLPAVELETLVMEETSPLDAKRVTMRLRWQGEADRLRKPLVLTAWVFRPREDAP